MLATLKCLKHLKSKRTGPLDSFWALPPWLEFFVTRCHRRQDKCDRGYTLVHYKWVQTNLRVAGNTRQSHTAHYFHIQYPPTIIQLSTAPHFVLWECLKPTKTESDMRLLKLHQIDVHSPRFLLHVTAERVTTTTHDGSLINIEWPLDPHLLWKHIWDACMSVCVKQLT